MKHTFTTFAKIFILLFIFTVSAQALDVKKREMKKKKSIAISYFENHMYLEALDLFLEIKENTKEAGMIDYMIGMCYMSSNEKEKALPYLLLAKATNRPSFVINYYLGKAYYESKNYNQALEYLSTYHFHMSHTNGIIFKEYSNVPVEHLIHYQKSVEEVSQIIKICESKITDNKSNENVNAITSVFK